MTIYDIFKLATEWGITSDFRPRDEVLNFSWRETVKNGAGDSFVNPYPDSGIVWTDNIDREVHTAVIGIDIEEPELEAMRAWGREAGKNIDLFIGHHSEGRPLSSFPAILRTQLGNLKSEGIDVNGLDRLFDKETSELQLDTISDNFNRVSDIAKLLRCDYFSLHSPIDNLSARFVERFIDGAAPPSLGACRDLLLQIPEYAALRDRNQVEPMIVVGKQEDELGRFLLTEFVGGEEGPFEIYDAMKKAGVQTLIAMHMSTEALKRIRHDRINVIAAGHLGSDSIGLNLLADALEKKGIEIIPIGGFIRAHHANAAI